MKKTELVLQKRKNSSEKNKYRGLRQVLTAEIILKLFKMYKKETIFGK